VPAQPLTQFAAQLLAERGAGTTDAQAMLL
jgi:hypothetical protein